MKRHIEKLKRRPENERKKMATIFAMITTVVVVIIWLIIMSFVKPDKEKNKEFSSFDNLKKELSEINEGFPEIESQFNFNEIKNNLEEIENKDNNEEIEILE